MVVKACRHRCNGDCAILGFRCCCGDERSSLWRGIDGEIAWLVDGRLRQINGDPALSIGGVVLDATGRWSCITHGWSRSLLPVWRWGRRVCGFFRGLVEISVVEKLEMAGFVVVGGSFGGCRRGTEERRGRGVTCEMKRDEFETESIVSRDMDGVEWVQSMDDEIDEWIGTDLERWHAHQNDLVIRRQVYRVFPALVEKRVRRPKARGRPQMEAQRDKSGDWKEDKKIFGTVNGMKIIDEDGKITRGRLAMLMFYSFPTLLIGLLLLKFFNDRAA